MQDTITADKPVDEMDNAELRAELAELTPDAQFPPNTKDDTLRAKVAEARAARDTAPDDNPDDPGDDDSGEDVRPVTMRVRDNRGSTRRLLRAAAEFDKAAKAFVAELDRQLFLGIPGSDERVGRAPLSEGVTEIAAGVQAHVNAIVAGDPLPGEVPDEEGDE